MRSSLLVAGLLLVACGGPVDPRPTACDVAAAVERFTCVLDGDATLGWINAGLEPLRHARDAIESGSPAVRPLGGPEVQRHLRQSDVILVADLHDVDLVRRSLHRLLRAQVDREDLAAGRIALGFEAVPPEAQEALRNAVRARDRAAVRAVLAGCWPWPVDAYVDVLLDPALAGLVLFGLGSARDGRYSCPDVPDAERRPQSDLTPVARPARPADETPYVIAPDSGFGDYTDWQDIKYGVTFHRKNAVAAHGAALWAGSGERGRRMFVLYGAAHLLEDRATGNGIADLLVRVGVRVAVVVPFLAGWERALHRRFGSAAMDTAYEVLPGVLRIPPDPRDVVALSPPPAPAAVPGPLPPR